MANFLLLPRHFLNLLTQELDDWASQDATAHFHAELVGSPDSKQTLLAHRDGEQIEPRTHTGYHQKMKSESSTSAKEGHNRNSKRLEQERQQAPKAHKLRAGGPKESFKKSAHSDPANFEGHLEAHKAKAKEISHVPPHGKHCNRNTAVSVETLARKYAKEEKHAEHTSPHTLEPQVAIKSYFKNSDRSVHTHEHAQDRWDDHPGYHGVHDGESLHNEQSHENHAMKSKAVEYDGKSVNIGGGSDVKEKN